MKRSSRRFYTFRLTKRQLAEIDESVVSAGLSRSAWVRERALAAARTRAANGKPRTEEKATNGNGMTTLVSIYVSGPEFDEIARAAAKHKMMPSEFVRSAALGALA